jgi:transposase-like protein
MSDPDFHELLLNAFFPNGIPPYQYGNLAVLWIDIDELYDLYYQVDRTEKENKNDTRQESLPIATNQLQNNRPVSTEPEPKYAPPKKMGRPPRVPGSLGLKCPKCGSLDVLAGGFGPNKERRIKCKTCGSQPIVSANTCPDCASANVIKYGVRRGDEDIQMFKCKSCDRKFSSSQNSNNDAAITEVLLLHTKGLSSRKIADELSERGFGDFSHTTICKWINSPASINVPESPKNAETVAERPFFSDRIDERILQLEFDDLSPEEISAKLQSDGAIISPDEILARLNFLHITEDTQ